MDFSGFTLPGRSEVAEIGVGTGVLTSALLKRLRSTSKSGGVVGFEIDEEILKEGPEKREREREDVN